MEKDTKPIQGFTAAVLWTVLCVGCVAALLSKVLPYFDSYRSAATPMLIVAASCGVFLFLVAMHDMQRDKNKPQGPQVL